jgi:hypothetical protein
MSAAIALCTPTSEEEKQAVLDQLERLLAHPVFKNSKRFPVFLRYVVEQTLEGASDHPVKERSIGVEVFGREVGYDTNHDPIVRITAGEVRKRIAQYYHEAGHETEIRIEIPTGSYVPEFFSPSTPSPVLPPAAPLIGPAALNRARTTIAGRPVRRWVLAGVALAVVLSFGASFVMNLVSSGSPESAVEKFWNPVFASSAPVLLCIGQPPKEIAAGGPMQQTVDNYVRTTDHITLSDTTALANLVYFLGKRGKSYRVQGSSSTSLTDLRQGSAILIAGFDNPWTLRAANSLRFRFLTTSPNPYILSIQDHQNPARTWSVNYDAPYFRLTQDFAIVARFFNSSTGQMQVIAAGIGANGTIAAGEFLSDPRFLMQIAARAPSGWEHKNLEAVIATQVIDEKSASPHLLAVHFW